MSKTRSITTDRGTLERTWLPITVDEVGQNPWNNGKDRAQLRQRRITAYPAATVNSENTDNLFELSAFGLDTAEEHESVLVGWLDVPVGTSVQEVEKQLKKFPNATIFRIMGNHIEDVLTKGQLYAAYSDEYPDYDIDKAKRSHIVMLPQKDGSIYPITKDGILLTEAVKMDADGKVTEILDETGLQYRATGFRLEYAEDVDKRDAIVKAKPDAGMRELVNSDPAETVSE